MAFKLLVRCSNLVDLNRENSVEELNRKRFELQPDYGALSILRDKYDNEAVLLVPIQQAWRASMLTALETLPDAESSLLVASSDKEEE